MKILHFYRTYFPDTQGGLEETIRQICASTKAHGVESRILTLSANPEPRVMHFPEADVYRAKLDLDIASCSMGREAFSMFRELEQWADIMHFHFPWPFADFVQLFSSRTTKPYVVTYHSDIVRQRWLEKLYRPLMHHFLRRSSRIVATSPNYAQSSTILKKYVDKLEIIPIGLDESSYPAPSEKLLQATKNLYGQSFILFIGVLREYKGLQTLVTAMKHSPIPLVIAGQGPLGKALQNQAHQLELTNIHFAGYVSNETKFALLHACKAVVLPSHRRSEAFGVSLLEGAMMSKPLITTDIGTGTSYINIHKKTGLIVKPNSDTELLAAFTMLNRNDELAHTLGAAARARFLKLFQAKDMGAKYSHLYAQIDPN